MVHCHDLKKGDIFICEECGLELEVTKSCDCSDTASCGEGFSCCGGAMKKQ